MTGIILAHGAASDCVERHIPNWQAAFSEIIIISPYDDPVPGSCMIGDSCRTGRGIMERILFAAVMASRFKAAAILEYDALIFQRLEEWDIVPGEMLCSVRFLNDDDQFSAETYSHCPWVATGEDWWRIVGTGADAQGGNPDRWLAQACELSGVKQLGTIESYSTDRDWPEERILEAIEAKRSGATFIHGVKSEEVLQRIMQAKTELTPAKPSRIVAENAQSVTMRNSPAI